MVSSASAQGTAFLYQGRLNDGGSPATGSLRPAVRALRRGDEWQCHQSAANQPGRDRGRRHVHAGYRARSLPAPITGCLSACALNADTHRLHPALAAPAGAAGAICRLRHQREQPARQTSGGAVVRHAAGQRVCRLHEHRGSNQRRQLQFNGTFSGNFNGVFTGNGSGLSSLNGSAIASGTRPPTRGSRPMLLCSMPGQTFTGPNQLFRCEQLHELGQQLHRQLFRQRTGAVGSRGRHFRPGLARRRLSADEFQPRHRHTANEREFAGRRHRSRFRRGRRRLAHPHKTPASPFTEISFEREQQFLLVLRQYRQRLRLADNCLFRRRRQNDPARVPAAAAAPTFPRIQEGPWNPSSGTVYRPTSLTSSADGTRLARGDLRRQSRRFHQFRQQLDHHRHQLRQPQLAVHRLPRRTAPNSWPWSTARFIRRPILAALGRCKAILPPRRGIPSPRRRTAPRLAASVYGYYIYTSANSGVYVDA